MRRIFIYAEKKEYILSSVILIYLLCFVFRILEYFVLRTDETFWGEAFVHKLIGIAILFAALKHLKLTFIEIGFKGTGIWKDLLSGFMLGLSVFAFAYFVEILFVMTQGKFESLALYVSAYSVNGSVGNQTGFFFFIVCIAGNIINVIMEEGIFRGLFQRILEKKFPFIAAAIIGSSLFGFWHIMAPARSLYDGAISCNSFMANTDSGIVNDNFAESVESIHDVFFVCFCASRRKSPLSPALNIV